MSQRKSDSVYEGVYSRHLAPSNTRNPARDRGNLLESMYRRIITEIAVNRVKWVGLPDTVDTRFLELTLFYNGLAVFYYEPEFNRYLALRASGNGTVNMYDNPTAFMVTGNAMLNRQLKTGDTKLVPIWNNATRSGDVDIMNAYAYRLAHFDRTTEINSTAMRHPFLIAGSRDMELSLKNVYKQVAEGQPMIVGSEGLMDVIRESVSVFNMSVDKDIIMNMMIAKSKLWNECMTLLGINNANQDKRERLVASEVSANDEQINAMRDSIMRPRMLACEEMGRLFDLEVSVHWNTSGSTLMPDMGNSESTTSFEGVV